LVVGQDQTPIPKKGAEYDFERLAAELKKAKDGHPDKNDAQVVPRTPSSSMSSYEPWTPHTSEIPRHLAHRLRRGRI